MKIEMVEGESLEASVGENVLAAELNTTLEAATERLCSAAAALEAAADRMRGQSGVEELQATVERALAAMDSKREGELQRQLHAAEAEIAELRVNARLKQSENGVGQRKTVPAVVTNLLSKQGVSLDLLHGEAMQGGALDAALGSLSLEQRIAVKAQLMRAGLLS